MKSIKCNRKNSSSNDPGMLQWGRRPEAEQFHLSKRGDKERFCFGDVLEPRNRPCGYISIIAYQRANDNNNHNNKS
jgi:hypothetical protein